MQLTRRSCLSAGLVSMLGFAGKVRAQSPRPASSRAAGAAAGTATASGLQGGGRVIRVGPRGEVVAVSVAAEIARDGDTIEIEAGEYRGDVAVFKQKRLSIRGVGGKVRMIADGKHAEGKAIWVLRDGDFEISGVQFEGTRVPSRNGAGIRFERGRLSLEDCRFIDNENGLLTGNDAQSELRVHACQFSGMFTKPAAGHYHNLYVGSIGRVHVSASYFSRAQVGHLLKSRARESTIVYNRLSDEDGRASYELEFPNGGKALVMGNLIVQENATENGGIVSYGAEGYRWPANELLLMHNTIVNRRPAGATLVRVFPGSALGLMQNNVFVGKGSFNGINNDPVDGNVMLMDERQFVDPAGFDFRLQPRAAFRGKAEPLSPFGDTSRVPTEEYRHPMQTVPMPPGIKLSPGAFQS